MELEILGPLRALGPGERSVLVEHWEVRSDVDTATDPGDLAAILGRALPGSRAESEIS